MVPLAAWSTDLRVGRRRLEGCARLYSSYTSHAHVCAAWTYCLLGMHTLRYPGVSFSFFSFGKGKHR